MPPALSWVLAVGTDATVTVAHVAPEFPDLPRSGWHGSGRFKTAAYFPYVSEKQKKYIIICCVII